MAVVDDEVDVMSTLWAVITELSEQLNQNRSLAVSLYSQAGGIKNQAVHTQTGFVLRRFNLDKSQEAYDAELERMNAVMGAENQALQHDNKQLNTLIKEYEQTLETLMSTFRNRAQDVQERELNLIREYESKLLDLEESNSREELETSVSFCESIAKISDRLRQTLESITGDERDDSLEREIELARLEKENIELRRMLGLLPFK